MSEMEVDIVFSKSEVEENKKFLGRCFGCLFLHLQRTGCNTTSGWCTRPDGKSTTFITSICGIEPPKTHD